MKRSVKESLEKACDSALLAVEIYNKPAVKFKSGGYISLMVIAWTSLFHAIFFNQQVKPFYRDGKRRFKKLNGDFKYWELDECLRNYYGNDTGNPVRKNLEFFIPLRNQIEHRSMPELDSNIYGECQCMLLNFDALIEKEFGAKHQIRESLSFALQLYPSSKNLVDAVKHNPSTKPVVDFIQAYRSAISADVHSSGKFAFKAFLFQVGNNGDNALPIQFINYDKLSDAEKALVPRMPALIKYKSMPVSNLDTMKPADVVRKVQIGLGDIKTDKGGKKIDKFNQTVHAVCWKKYKVRPAAKSKSPEETISKYCIYDRAHQDYLYTQEWVDFLLEKLKDPNEFTSLFKSPTSAPFTPLPPNTATKPAM